jgi:NAD-dependent dihydropyrimidine dehydrogenase PreA subunit
MQTKNKTVRKIISIDESRCNGCGQCVTACAEGAIKIINGKAKLVSDTYCDGLGACLGDCPTGALKIIEREAAPFDEAAVPVAPPEPAHACPSMQSRIFARPATAAASTPSESGLGHWPVQIRLLSPNAPFLENAELFVSADCVPVAWPGFHDAIRGKVVMVGCPKFDDAELYVERFRQIFKFNNIRKITVAVMQVPCCQSLPMIIQEAMHRAGVNIPLEKTTISLNGARLT